MNTGDVVAEVLQLALQENNNLLFLNASFANFHGVNISTVLCSALGCSTHGSSRTSQVPLSPDG